MTGEIVVSEKISIAISLIKSYLNDIYENKDRKIINAEIVALLSITSKEFGDIDSLSAHIDYNQLQTRLAVLNEKEDIQKSKGVYYTPADVVKFILTNAVKSHYGKLRPSNIHVMDLNGIPYKSFCLTKKVYDPTCGAGEFLLSALEMKFNLMDIHNDSIGKTTIQKIIRTIYGNDINKDSIKISKLRLFLCTLRRFGVRKIKGISIYINNNFTELDFVTNNPENNMFDIIVGNPPYVEDSKSDVEPKTKYGNIYCNVLDNSAHLLGEKGVMGFVIPLSYVSTPRMKSLRDNLFEQIKEQYILSYSDRPDCLFSSVHQKLCIIIARKRNILDKIIYTDSYKYWYNQERTELFESTQAVKNTFCTDEYIPKLGSTNDVNIYKKIIANKQSINELLSGINDSIYLNMRASFWIKAFITSHKGAEYKEFRCADENIRNYCMCLLNSSLFWWYWICVSDCWHITQKELNGFKVPKIDNFCRLNDLAIRLETDLEEKKEYVGTKQTEYEYKHKNCTEIIHQIDDEINNIFDLTEQESLYIKQFAYRFRTSGGIYDENN